MNLATWALIGAGAYLLLKQPAVASTGTHVDTDYAPATPKVIDVVPATPDVMRPPGVIYSPEQPTNKVVSVATPPSGSINITAGGRVSYNSSGANLVEVYTQEAGGPQQLFARQPAGEVQVSWLVPGKDFTFYLIGDGQVLATARYNVPAPAPATQKTIVTSYPAPAPVETITVVPVTPSERDALVVQATYVYAEAVRAMYAFWRALPTAPVSGAIRAGWGVLPGEVRYMTPAADSRWDEFLRTVSYAATRLAQLGVPLPTERSILGLP